LEGAGFEFELCNVCVCYQCVKQGLDLWNKQKQQGLFMAGLAKKVRGRTGCSGLGVAVRQHASEAREWGEQRQRVMQVKSS
jgi:hypothetical protein